jgi:hypothetical protein
MVTPLALKTPAGPVAPAAPMVPVGPVAPCLPRSALRTFGLIWFVLVMT